MGWGVRYRRSGAMIEMGQIEGEGQQRQDGRTDGRTDICIHRDIDR